MTDAEKLMLMNVLDEITALLCYQVDIPLGHKQDLAAKVEDFRLVFAPNTGQGATA